MEKDRDCGKCGTPIAFEENPETGNIIPLDVSQTRTIYVGGRIVKGYVSHYLTCPHADDF